MMYATMKGKLLARGTSRRSPPLWRGWNFTHETERVFFLPIIGIDLGTTNSLAAVWKDGRCQLIPNALGEVLTPSAVSLDEDGALLVGRAARDRLITHPERTAASFKRFMGTDTKLLLGDCPFTPVELSALVLRRLKEDAEAFLGEPVEEAVISVPAYFDDNGRSATKAAGELAGFRVERIINEPSAAALAYHKDQQEDQSFLIVDFGGGTLDVSVVDAFLNVIEIVAVAGDNHLGGDDFNLAIAHYFCEQNGLAMGDLPRETQSALLRQAEQCKIALTSADPVMMLAEIGGQQRSVLLSNQKLITICSKLLRRMEKPLARALRDCSGTVGTIDDVILVGGSCHMPLVRQYLAHVLGMEPLCSLDADTTVAVGAGIAAGIKERQEDLRDTLLTDICPFTLGVSVLNREDPSNPLFSPIIERNTTLPASRMRTYYTAADGQDTMQVEIYQGEGMYCADNLKLGEVSLHVPPAARGKESAEVRFTYDINGILQVELTCKSTGQKNETVIVNPRLNLTPEALERRLKELETYKLLPREATANRELLARAAHLYAQSTGELRERLQQYIDRFHALLHFSSGSQLHRFRQELNRFLNEIEDSGWSDDDEVLRAFREDPFSDDEEEEESL